MVGCRPHSDAVRERTNRGHNVTGAATGPRTTYGGAVLRGLVLDVGGVLVGPGTDLRALAALVAHLRGKGVRTALLSNDPGGPQAQWLRNLAGPFVDRVVLSGDEGVSKPDPDSYLRVARLLALDPAECVFVDDLTVNVRGAAAAGMVGVHHDGAREMLEELAVLFDVDLSRIDPTGADAGWTDDDSGPLHDGEGWA